MKSRTFLLVLVAGGVFTPSVLAQTSGEIDIPFKKFVFDNGLTLIVHEDHKAPIVRNRCTTAGQPQGNRHGGHERRLWRDVCLAPQPELARGQRPFIALAPVQTDKTSESLEEMSKEFRGIRGARPITPDELSKVQANETLTLPGSRETQSEVGPSILDLVRFGWPDDYYETYAGKVRALKVSDLEDAAKTVIHSDSLTWVIVGDSSKIESGVRELNLGELHLISPEGKPL